MDLGAYIAAARTKPWAWREHDCTAFPAIWAGFGDALPAYTNEAEAEAIIREAGGIVPLWDAAVDASPGKAEPIDLEEIAPGDVAVIELLTVADVEEFDEQSGELITVAVAQAVEVGAIWTGKRWAFVPKPGGVAAVSSAVMVKAWRPMCLKR